MLALWDEADQWHQKAEQARAKFRSAKSPVITTTFVLLECGNAAARRPYRRAATLFRDIMVANDGLVVPSQEDWIEAWNAYDKGDAGQAGIVDQVSFVVMRRLGLRQAFTNDRHFNAAGFETLF
jgi:predicted nucleic acid-binding protein